jgi:hypothetical protein
MIIGALPRTAYGSFVNYVAGCLEKLGLDRGLVTAGEAQEYLDAYSAKEDHIRIAWTLSAILAPVLESYVHCLPILRATHESGTVSLSWIVSCSFGSRG